MTTSKGLVLVTGANGYIAARTVEAYLLAGFSVRGTVRKASSATGILSALAPFVAEKKLDIIEVPDITAAGAFDTALQGVDHIAHLAAPVSLHFTEAESVLRTATESVRRILESASKQEKLQSVVLMSSIAAVRPSLGREGPYLFSEKDWNNDAETLLAQLGDKAPGGLIYTASKVAAEKTFWKFHEDNKPHFSMIAVNPVFVSGPPLVQPTSVKEIGGTFSYVYQIASGQEIPDELFPGASWYVDVRDVGRVVVGATEKRQKLDRERVVVSGYYAPPQAAADILRETFPEKRDIIKAGTPREGYKPGFKPLGEQDIDGSKAVSVMGKEYLAYETTVLDTLKSLANVL